MNNSKNIAPNDARYTQNPPGSIGGGSIVVGFHLPGTDHARSHSVRVRGTGMVRVRGTANKAGGDEGASTRRSAIKEASGASALEKKNLFWLSAPSAPLSQDIPRLYLIN